MKRNHSTLQKGLAMLLCLCMVSSLLPVGALAAAVPAAAQEKSLGVPPTGSSESSEEPMEPADLNNSELSAEEGVLAADENTEVTPLSSTTPEDGAVADTWIQDPNTIVPSSVTPIPPTIVDGKLKLSAIAPNGNNCDGNPPPAFFTNATLDAAVVAVGAGERELSFTVTPDSDTANICMGFALNYTSRSNNVFIGYNTMGGWFVQYYGGTDAYPSFEAPVLEKKTSYDITIKWTDTAITLFKVGDTVCTMPNNGSFEGVTVADKVGFKVGKDPQTQGVTNITLSNVHYTGQEVTTVYDISGTVTDGTNPVAGATVTVGGKTATTDESGNYTVRGFSNGDYTVTVAKTGYWSPEAAQVTITSADVTGNALTLTPYVYNNVSGTVTKEDGAPLAGAAVAAGGVKAVTDAEGKYTLTNVLGGEQNLTVSLDAYGDETQAIAVAKTANTPLTGVVTVLKPDLTIATLSTADMDVRVDLTFPRVVKYTLKNGSDAGKIMFGQTKKLDTVTINGVNVVPVVTSEVAADKSKITYKMAATGANIDCVIHAELVAEGKTLSFNITGIDNNLERLDYPVERVSIPNHSLVSVRSNQAGANLFAAQFGSSTIVSGDKRYNADQLANANDQRFFYAFASNDELSAGVASNSEFGNGAAASNNYRVLASSEVREDYTSLGLSSSEWYYDRKVSSSDGTAQQNAPIAYQDKVMGPTELPLYLKVVVTGDENGDKSVNWQDGAIVARDTIIHKPHKSDEIRDSMSTRIAMNFNSQAQNPFLTTLDNVKRVYLNTDGLGQSILLKGYANEGHDSGHPDYGDIGRRMGGAEDMNKMMEEGAELGAHFGIHVNASEYYPEAKAFTSKLTKRGANGGLAYGWNWLDQGIAMNGLYDLASGSRVQRWADLKYKVGDNLDFVYVDVWGNGTSGSEDAWQTRKLSKQLTNNDWRVVHEWGYANEWDSTFQHWVSDYGYGEYDQKGKYNSEIERFLFNSYKDSFAPDFPNFGGSANAPLLGGAITQGFEGWQGDGEYNAHIESVFEHMIPAKFLQHYDVMQWVDAPNAVEMPYHRQAGGEPNLATPASWTPEAQIKLQSADRASTVVVTRGSDEAVNETYAYGTDAERQEYRSRTITLDGKVVLRGAPSPSAGGTSYVNSLYPLANQQYLLPWLWDAKGNALAANNQKLYHRNDVGGESTWDLPNGWENLATVKVYELTDNGRMNETVVSVVNGTVTLTAVAQTPYVVVKGEKGAATPTVEWSTGLHLKDVGFNAATIEDNWTVNGSGTAERALNRDQQSVLKLSGTVAVSQEYTDLIPGKTYATYVAVDNRSAAKASMTVKAGDTVLATNYTEQSIAKNYISAYSLHNGHPMEGNASYFQNMYVFFTAPASGKVTLTLNRETGEGNTYFDDVRTLETQMNNFTYGADGAVLKFTQDFEHSPQGQYPFVVGPIEGISDSRQHLSEKHEPYTQAGWDVKKMDDVLSGDWSIKINGLSQRNNLAYQTIPQNFHFEPGVTYTVKFDYQMGSAGTYEAVYGTGAYNASAVTAVPLRMSLGSTATCTFTIVGDPSGQTWIGIKSTNIAPDLQGTSDSAANFGGYQDFVLDNLVIERSTAQKGELAALIATATGMMQADYAGDWAAFAAAKSAAQTVMNNQKATQAQIDAAITALDTAMKALTKQVGAISGTITSGGNPVAGAVITLEKGTAYTPTGLTATTGVDGTYKFENLSLSITDYNVKVVAAGYDVKTQSVGTLTNGVATTQDVTLTAQEAAAYVNTFDTGDVSMMVGLTSADTAFTVEPIQHNGSGALKIHFTGNRNTNNVVDKSFKMKNGTFSFDMTTLDSGVRFGADLRANAADSRIQFGTFDNINMAGLEYWAPANGYPSGSVTGPGFARNVTRHVEYTMADQKFTMKWDGVTVFDDTVTNAPSTAGYVGFSFGNSSGTSNASFIIDNIRINPTDVATADTYAISGKVLGESSAPISGAQVNVLGAADAVITRNSTKLDGTYTTAAVPAGEYKVKISAPGYVGQTVSATVSGAAVTLADVTLAVDVAQLQALYDTNKDKTKDYYTDASWTNFQTKLTQAKGVLDAPKATDVAKAYNELNAAIAALTEMPLDKGMLRTYYNSFNSHIASDYTVASWVPFQTALRNAAVVLSDSNAKQGAVNAACDALVNAEKALVRVGGGSIGGGGSNNTTKTEKNPDGSSTTTVTNGTTGTVTETTTGTDGTKVVTETKKDGTSTTEVTLPKNPKNSVTLPGKPISAGDSITIKTDKGTVVVIPVENMKPGIVPVIVKADGTEEIVKKSVTTVDGVTLTLDGSAVIKFKDNSKSFADVAENHWAADAIAFATSRELFKGTGADRFSPMGDMTRSMLVTVLARLDGQDTTGGETWYSQAMAWGVETGITDGANVDTNITRESLVVMLYRYAKAESAGGIALSEFSDAGEVSGWATEAMNWAVANGILNGAGGKLNPTATASRAEVSAMLMRFVTALNK